MVFYTAQDVMSMLGISRTRAYEIIRGLNKSLKAKGYITIPGRVPKKYLEEKLYCSEATNTEKEMIS